MSKKIQQIQERHSIKHSDPGAYQAMSSLQQYVNASEISPLHREMIKIRASMVNGCAYCVQSHSADARKLGESEARVYSLSTWWESPLYTETERILLAMTDEISLISESGLSDDTYQAAVRTFGEKVTTQVIMQIITINAWNRIAISTHMIFKNG
jgi:AhpD family alkylhydroperoxidase